MHEARTCNACSSPDFLQIFLPLTLKTAPAKTVLSAKLQVSDELFHAFVPIENFMKCENYETQIFGTER